MSMAAHVGASLLIATREFADRARRLAGELDLPLVVEGGAIAGGGGYEEWIAGADPAGALAGGTHVCLRAVDPAGIWRLLRTAGITHFSAAPTVLTMIAEDAAAGAPGPRRARRHRRRAAVGHPAGPAGEAPPGGHSPVRAHRDLRPAGHQRMAARVGSPRAGKVPKRFEFRELPKTSTGNIQKSALRDQAHDLDGSS